MMYKFLCHICVGNRNTINYYAFVFSKYNLTCILTPLATSHKYNQTNTVILNILGFYLHFIGDRRGCEHALNKIGSP